jgi:sec-independent protein translocase protein TatC
MATAAPQSDRAPKADDASHSDASHSNGFDPDSYRMTVGEHLEELRSRLIRAMIGFFAALIVCFLFYERVIWYFCKPLIQAYNKHELNPQLIVDEVGEGFMVAIKISMIVAAAVAGPWILYQLWQFVAAGLYPHERKYVTKYLPLSMTLLVSGMLFVYFLVLPWTLDFFLGWNKTIPLDFPGQSANTFNAAAPTTQATAVEVPIIEGTPSGLSKGRSYLWVDPKSHRLMFFHQDSLRIIPFNADTLLGQEYKLSHYMDLVVMMLITFGLSFQLPLAVLTLERIGIVDVDALRSGRRYVYFAMVVAAAVITPGDVITATIALMFPLIGLYELGIWLATLGRPKAEPA